MGELLQLCGVSQRCRRGEQSPQLLADVSLAVAPGEIVAVVGSPSTGKTTLLKIAAGMVVPDSGQVRFDGLVLGDLSQRRRERLLGKEIAWTDRERPRMSWFMRDYVGLALATGRGHGSRQARDKALDALARVGVPGGASRRWEDLSDWERVLVGFARVVVCAPRLALVDGLLDGLGRHKLLRASDLLHELADELRCGVLMSASDVQSAVVADQVWAFERGGRLSSVTGRPEGDATVIEFPAGADRGQGARSAGS